MSGRGAPLSTRTRQPTPGGSGRAALRRLASVLISLTAVAKSSVSSVCARSRSSADTFAIISSFELRLSDGPSTRVSVDCAYSAGSSASGDDCQARARRQGTRQARRSASFHTAGVWRAARRERASGAARKARRVRQSADQVRVTCRARGGCPRAAAACTHVEEGSQHRGERRERVVDVLALEPPQIRLGHTTVQAIGTPRGRRGCARQPSCTLRAVPMRHELGAGEVDEAERAVRQLAAESVGRLDRDAEHRVRARRSFVEAVHAARARGGRVAKRGAAAERPRAHVGSHAARAASGAKGERCERRAH